ncbi:MAG: putative cobalt-precorrin-6B C(15)-methyltransferase (decarboxylating) [ANME-2 cluster archaeon]|nr:putative cobalt-precorrin-6B C(15)-methyltransferase (decarboxylating) [ANME-2 cluster archaeon]
MKRIRSPKFSKPVFTCGEGVRFATPEIVASYRAGRLKTGVLADISCGIGGQAVCFADECNRVYGVDIDGERLECARRNAGVYGVDNITFIEGDALSPQVVEQVADADIIFSDPARPIEEDVRQTDSLRPGIPMVMEAYRDVTGSFAFEAPPQMPPERIDFDCEREYLSLDGQLNRLTLYFGPLKRCERSAVVLKRDMYYRLKSGVSIPPGIPEADKIPDYAFEPDPAVVKAELLGELAAGLNINMGLVKIDARRSLLTSLSNIDSPFFKNRYRVLDKVTFDCNKINRLLKEHNIGKALIRFNVAPDRYWDVRNKIESGLVGETTCHLYQISGMIYIMEMLKSEPSKHSATG